jgi:preprotein translocase subunit Sec61beta
MALNKKSIAMPVTMAGLPSFTSSESIGGVKISPVHFLIGIVAFAVIIKLLQAVYS